MGVPGFDPTPFTATGLEHDETGEPNYTPEMHTAQMDKRGVKFERVAELLCALEPPLGCQACGVPEETAEVGVLTWGSTAGAAREAVEELAAEGYPVAGAHPGGDQPAAGVARALLCAEFEGDPGAGGEPQRPVCGVGQGPY